MKIKSIEVTGSFRYLWLKTVENVNLSVHCARCLIGEYDSRIKPFKGILEELELKDKYYYLCGVALPYKWENNFHLAFKPCKGSKIDIKENGINIIIEDAERIMISPENIDPKDSHIKYKSYCTCRNWQFAHWFKNRTNLE